MGQIRQIGANIRFYREKKGLTQRELADSLIVSFQAISAWERGISVPDLENAVRIANFFGITVDALLAGATQELYVGIDGGGSKTEFVLFEADGTVCKVLRMAGSNPNDKGLEASQQILLEGLEQLLAGRTPRGIFAGIAGTSAADLRTTMAARLQERFRSRVAVDSDATNVLSCGSDPENVMAVICGTGSCVFVRKGQQRHRLGGWGYLLDQAGSAYDVGKDGLRCALGAEDGLQAETLMTRRIRQALGGDLFDSIPMIYEKGRPYIASLAPLVIEAAQAGDSCAEAILAQNAQRLATLIQTAVQRFGQPGQIVAAGSFLKNPLFHTMVETQAGVRLTLPEVPPVYGACIEALRQAGIPICPEFQKNFTDTYRRLSC